MQVYYFDERYFNRLDIVNGCVVVEYLVTLFSLIRINPNPFDNAWMMRVSSVNLALNPHEFRMVRVKNKPLWLNWRQIIYTWDAFEHNSNKWMFCGNEYNHYKRACYVMLGVTHLMDSHLPEMFTLNMYGFIHSIALALRDEIDSRAL